MRDINSWLRSNPVNCSRGAPLGRRDYTTDIDSQERKLYLQRVRLDSQGYSKDGTYWGSDILGSRLYCLFSDDLEIQVWLRATSRKDAVAQLRKTYSKYFKLHKEHEE